MERVENMLNREYVPRWKIELEQAKEENIKEVTKSVIMSEAIWAIEFMKQEGISEVSIRKFAKQKNISMKMVNDIMDSRSGKEAVQV